MPKNQTLKHKKTKVYKSDLDCSKESALILRRNSNQHRNTPIMFTECAAIDKDHIRAKMSSKNSELNRLVDIFKNKLIENSNQRGNIILNSLAQHKRAYSHHSKNYTPVADPKVYRLIGKLHQCSPLPSNQRKPDSSRTMNIKLK